MNAPLTRDMNRKGLLIYRSEANICDMLFSAEFSLAAVKLFLAEATRFIVD